MCGVLAANCSGLVHLLRTAQPLKTSLSLPLRTATSMAHADEETTSETGNCTSGRAGQRRNGRARQAEKKTGVHKSDVLNSITNARR